MINIFHNGLKKRLQGNADGGGSMPSSGYVYVVGANSGNESLMSALMRLANLVDPSKVTPDAKFAFFQHIEMPDETLNFLGEVYPFMRKGTYEAVSGSGLVPYDYWTFQRSYLNNGPTPEYQNIEISVSKEPTVATYTFDGEDSSSTAISQFGSAMIFIYDSNIPIARIISEMSAVFAPTNDEPVSDGPSDPSDLPDPGEILEPGFGKG